jgi:hypothetical protein
MVSGMENLRKVRMISVRWHMGLHGNGTIRGNEASHPGNDNSSDEPRRSLIRDPGVVARSPRTIRQMRGGPAE